MTLTTPPAARAGTGGVSSIPITIELRGTFPNATAALRDIEQLSVPLRVTTITARADGSTATTAPITLRIEGDLPWLTTVEN